LPRAALTLFVRDTLLACRLTMRLVNPHELRVHRVFGLGSAYPFERRGRWTLPRLLLDVAREVLGGLIPVLSAFGRVPILPFGIQGLDLLGVERWQALLL
jgi:hypothetical protein